MADPRNYLKGCPTLDDLLAFHYNLNQLLDAAGTPMTDQSGAPASSNHTPHTAVLLNDLYRQIGSLEGWKAATDTRLTNLEKDIADRLKGIEENIGELVKGSAAVKGGWKAVTVLSTIIVTGGAVVAWVIDKWDGIKNLIFK